MKRDVVDRFEKLKVQLDGFYEEMSALSKKSPNDAVNKFKIKFINVTLAAFNAVIGDKYKPFAGFAEFSEDDLPTNSDVSFIISQYIECAEKFRADNIANPSFGQWVWATDDINFKDSSWQRGVSTTPPKKLSTK